DEVTKEPYLMPVDVSGKNAADGIKLKDMYDKLTEFPSKRITVFIDACFSGGARNQGLLAARGVKVKAKEAVNNGNIIVFSASSGEQSSLPYKAKEHGFFTYFLLKKLKETQGNVNYSELSAYLKKNVSLQSVLLNDKEQTPQVNVSQSMIDAWGNISIK
ncbi:MAG TPA: caspase family protein, partial [Bacteroidales bacterium]